MGITSVIQSISVERVIVGVSSFGVNRRTWFALFDANYNLVNFQPMNTLLYTFTNDLRYAIDRSGKIYSVNIDWYNYGVTITQIASFPEVAQNDYPRLLGDTFLITGSNTNSIFYFDPLGNEQLALLDTNNYKIGFSENEPCFSNIKYSVDTTSSIFRYIHVKQSYGKLIGLRYQGEFYFREAAGILTAGQPDVKSGKSFIGWMGYPEIGTMETE